MDIEKIITYITGIASIISTLFTIAKQVVDFKELRKGKKPGTKTIEGDSETGTGFEEPPDLLRKKSSTSKKRKIRKLWLMVIAPIGSALAMSLFLYLTFRYLNIPVNYPIFWSILLIDIAVVLLLLDRWIYFFSQFVLPIGHPKDRREIYRRVYTQGPILFIRNGTVIMHEGSAEERGPGVVILDTASAAVLRTSTEIKETIGPGVKFTQPDEYLSGTIDLRVQQAFAGALPSSNPFNENPSGSPFEYRELNSKVARTMGQTRDGIGVSPLISVTFRVKRPPPNQVNNGKGNVSPFGFDPEATHRAITNKIRVVFGATIEWNRYPLDLAVDLWKEYIRKIKFEDLFSETGTLSLVEHRIEAHLKSDHVLMLDDDGIPTGMFRSSDEYQELNSYGLEVLSVRIHQIQFDPSTENLLLSRWNPYSLTLAKSEAKQLQEMEFLVEKASRKDAGRLFASTAARQIRTPGETAPKNIFHLAYHLILPVREYISRRGNHVSDNYNERDWDALTKWLLSKGADFSKGEMRGGLDDAAK